MRAGRSTGAGRASRRGLLACAGLFGVLVLACYRPRLVDCVVRCDVSQVCPETMTCSAGLCTRGATCVLAVAAGARHSCAVAGGDVRCWGNNDYGQLGIGDLQGRGADDTPLVSVALGVGRAPFAVAAGGRHSCALASDGAYGTPTAFCWGDNSFGQLGLAAVGTGGAPAGDTFAPVPLVAGRTAAAITAGLFHTCALLDDASVACWGDDRFGQRGAGVAAGAGLVAVDLGEPARAVSAGAYHSCAVLVSGAVRCWGWNDYGQLGAPTPSSTAMTATRAAITVDVPAAKGIAAGGFHSCALLTTGAVTCWGHNSAGQLGVPQDPNVAIFAPGSVVDLGSGHTARAIGAGAVHTCALLDDFSVRCWGYNVDGELGIGDADNRGDDEPLGDALPRVALGAAPVSTLTVGENHACVIQAAGVKCWGRNGSGQLGVGDSRDRGADPAHPIGLVRLIARP